MIELMIVILIIATISAIAIPNLLSARKAGNELGAIGSLKSIATAQRLFREGDKEGDGLNDYASLSELSNGNLIDPVLQTGTKQGYNFLTEASFTGPEYIFWSTGDPAVEGGTGDRHFATNHRGLIFYSSTAIIPHPLTGVISAGTPLGG